jgi:hypothetical protein
VVHTATQGEKSAFSNNQQFNNAYFDVSTASTTGSEALLPGRDETLQIVAMCGSELPDP